MAKVQFIFGVHNHQPVMVWMTKKSLGYGLVAGSTVMAGTISWSDFSLLWRITAMGSTTFVALAVYTNFIDADLTVPTPETRPS